MWQWLIEKEDWQLKMNHVMVKLGKECILLNFAEIDCIKAEGKYLRIYRGNRSYLKRQSLNSLETNLDPERFVRISRSTIINISQIKKIERTDDYKYQIRLNNDETLSWSRNYRKEFLTTMVV